MENLNDKFRGYGVNLSIGGRIITDCAEAVSESFKSLDAHSAYCMAEIQKVIMRHVGCPREWIIEAIQMRLEEITRELQNEQVSVAIVSGGRRVGGGRILGKVTTGFAMGGTFDEMAQEQPMTSKEIMLRGRPDLLKENWRRKGRKK